MAFPTSPINNQTTTVNGITYVYRSATNSWARVTANSLTLSGNLTAGNVLGNKIYTTQGLFWSGNGAAYSTGGGGSSFVYTASASAPGSPTTGDQWFDTTDGTLYEYMDDGDSFQWVDIQTPTFASNAVITSLSGDVSTSGNISASSIVITSGIYWANGVAFVSSVYSNVNVEAYIGGNVGSYQLYANANIGTLFLGNISTQANLGTLFLGNISTQANLGTLFLGNISTQANLGAFQTFSNSNAAAQATSINTINANIGAFYNYANTKIGTNTNSNLVVAATTTSTSTTTGALVIGGGAGIAGNVTSANVVTGNVYTSGNIRATNYQFANGVSILSTVGGTYSNTNVAAYLTLGATIGSGTPTSTSTTTGALIVQGGAGVSGNAYVGGELVVPGGGKLTSTGLAYLLEKVTVTSGAPSGNVNIDLSTQSVMYWTGNATGNVSANIRGTATQPLNSLLTTGQSVTAVIFLPNGPSNFLVTNVYIDNTTVSVAYQGNAAPALGNSNSIDIYSFTILKTASATYKVFASQTQFMHPG